VVTDLDVYFPQLARDDLLFLSGLRIFDDQQFGRQLLAELLVYPKNELLGRRGLRRRADVDFPLYIYVRAGLKLKVALFGLGAVFPGQGAVDVDWIGG
jgi:hypothetical protein